VSKKANSPSQSSNGRSTKARENRPQAAQSPFEILCGEPERINPAILLAEEMMRKQFGGAIDCSDIRRAEETINQSRREIGRVESQFAASPKQSNLL
jgi:hypothetical protein